MARRVGGIGAEPIERFARRLALVRRRLLDDGTTLAAHHDINRLPQLMIPGTEAERPALVTVELCRFALEVSAERGAADLAHAQRRLPGNLRRDPAEPRLRGHRHAGRGAEPVVERVRAELLE